MQVVFPRLVDCFQYSKLLGGGMKALDEGRMDVLRWERLEEWVDDGEFCELQSRSGILGYE